MLVIVENVIISALITLPCIVISHWLFHVIKTKLSKLPPGPVPLPLIGNAAMFWKRRPTDVFRSLRKKYGNIVTLHADNSTRIVLFLGGELIRKTFLDRIIGEIVSDRLSLFSESRQVTQGILWNRWPDAMKTRKFVMRTFKEIGLASSGDKHGQIRGFIHDEVLMLCEYIETMVGKPFDPRECLQNHIASCYLLPTVTCRLDLNEEVPSTLMNAVQKFAKLSFLELYFAMFSNTLSLLFPDVFKEVEQSLEITFAKVAKAELAKRRSTFKHGEEIRDMFDAFMEQESSAEAIPFHQYIRVVSDILTPGMEIPAHTMRWVLLYLARYPEWQERLYEEIVSFVGETAFPDPKHRCQMIQLQAFINEVLRLHATLPTAIYHAASKDLKIESDGVIYEIPKGIPISYSMESAHREETAWGDPDVFRPDRWLCDGKLVQHSNFMPFGIGRRSCIGESSTHLIFFLVLSTLIQRFTWRSCGPIVGPDGTQWHEGQSDTSAPSFQLEFSLRK